MAGGLDRARPFRRRSALVRTALCRTRPRCVGHHLDARTEHRLSRSRTVVGRLLRRPWRPGGSSSGPAASLPVCRRGRGVREQPRARRAQCLVGSRDQPARLLASADRDAALRARRRRPASGRRPPGATRPRRDRRSGRARRSDARPRPIMRACPGSIEFSPRRGHGCTGSRPRKRTAPSDSSCRDRRRHKANPPARGGGRDPGRADRRSQRPRVASRPDVTPSPGRCDRTRRVDRPRLLGRLRLEPRRRVAPGAGPVAGDRHRRRVQGVAGSRPANRRLQSGACG